MEYVYKENIMILDNQDQRQLLLTILNNTPFNGNIAQLTEMIRKVNELGLAIQNAEVKENV